MEPTMGPKSYENETLEHRNNGARLGAVHYLQIRPDRDLVPKRVPKWSPKQLILGSVGGPVLEPFFEPSLEPTVGGTDPAQGTQGTDMAKKGVPKWTQF